MSDGQTLGSTLGFVSVHELTETRARIEYRARMDQAHSGGVIQGGFVTAWIDAAMAHAAIARHGQGIVPMTLEIKISFFAPARPGPVFAEGWVERAGRRTEFYEGRLLDGEGNVLAKGTSTLQIVDLAKVQAKVADASGGGAA